VADVDERRLAEGAKKLSVDPARAYGDLRKILDDPDVDGVVIATPPKPRESSVRR
jgi:predicted dehydrogenase